jgi:methylmalonyl-CoA mutase C-terminal domain/subunit
VAEDVDIIGLSVLSGAHLGLTRKTLDALAERGGGDIPVVVGGTIPASDTARLLEMGVTDVFPTGTPLEDIARRMAAAAGLQPSAPA